MENKIHFILSFIAAIFIQKSEAWDPPILEPVILTGDHCQVPDEIQGEYHPGDSTGLLQVDFKPESMSYLKRDERGLLEEGTLYCIWNDDNRMLFAKDKFRGNLELTACIEAELTPENNLEVVFYNRWDHGPFQLQSSPATSSNSCGNYPEGGSTLLLYNSFRELVLPDTCSMPERMRGKYQVRGGLGLKNAEVGYNFVKVELNIGDKTEEVTLWCIYDDETRLVFAKDRYEEDKELAACVTLNQGYNGGLQIEFLNRRDYGLFWLDTVHATISNTCVKSPGEGTTVQLTQSN